MSIFRFVSACSALLVVGLMIWIVVTRSHPPQASTAGDTAAEQPPLRALTLSAEHSSAAGIQLETVSRQTLRVTRTLAARFAYDDALHVAVRAPTDGVLESVLVKTGDHVQVGQPIATLRSPLVGKARSEVLSSEASLALATRQLDWESQRRDGVEELAKLIREGTSIESIEQRLDDSKLGDYRGQLLANYSRSQLTTKLLSSVRQIGQAGAVSGRVVQERQSDQQQAEAELDSSIEQALFETRQAYQAAEAAAAAARRDVLVARQSLNTILGATADADETLDVSPHELNLSKLTIVAPLSGTVERKNFSATERVIADSELFVIADTNRLWVTADIRERDWSSIDVQQGDRIDVSTPADPDAIHQAEVYYVGREVNPDSGAIPLVLRIANQDQKFRPGMFARVEVPTSTRADVISVPSAAVIDLEGQSNVFVQQGESFVPQRVEVGARSGDQWEIRTGLVVGQQIVVAGAFVLKSELLLAGEE
jgi:RND family efflux transporter MFP subunit